MINQHYKNRHDDDLNITLSVQSWGSDGDKRRYYLIEGNDDTAFRVYRESNPAGLHRTWWSVAGSIDELKALSAKLETTDGGPKARALSKKMMNSVPRFEATEEKRKRREYRQMRKEAFKRPEPGLSLYEGRTRGKRMKYTYSDDEDEFYTDSTNRRSTRNTRNHTPAEPTGPLTTASGRQIRAPTRLNADTTSNGAPSASTSVNGDTEMAHTETIVSRGRPRRSAAVNHGTNGWASKKRKSEEYDSDEDDGISTPDLGDDEDDHVPDDEDDEEDDFEEDAVDDDLDDVAIVPRSPRIFKFPLKAIVEDGKAKKLPGTPPADGGLEKRKHPRAAHRNIIVSDESSNPTTPGAGMGPGDENDTEDDDGMVQEPEEEPPAAESIDVVVKRIPPPPTPESPPTSKTTGTVTLPPNGLLATNGGGEKTTPLKSLPSTSQPLAFRGSPEKPPSGQPHIPTQAIDVGGGQ